VKIEYFREFLILAKYMNFSAAAEHMFITQPALSRHLAALEQELGVRLLNRTTQEVSLTPAGELFQERMTQMMSSYDELLSLLRLQSDGYTERLVVGVPYYALSDYLGRVPYRFERRYPQIKLIYDVGSPDYVLAGLNQGRIDVALLAHLPFPDSKSIAFRDFDTERLCVLVNENDPIARKNTCSVSDLEGKIIFKVGGEYFSSSWAELQRLCRKRGFEPISESIGLMESAIIGVRHGNGVAVVGWHMRSHAENGVVCVPLEDEDCFRDSSVCYRRNMESVPKVKKFVEMFFEEDEEENE